MKSALRKKVWAYVFLIGVALVVVALDQVTKAWVRRTISINEAYMPVEWLQPYVTLRHIQNTGAAFGLFPGFGTVFMAVAALVSLGIVVYVGRLDIPSPWLRLALGLLLGGTVGNLIDRIRMAGRVTDFVDLGWWPVFNVADSCVVVGTIILAIFVLFGDIPTEDGATLVKAAGSDAED